MKLKEFFWGAAKYTVNFVDTLLHNEAVQYCLDPSGLNRLTTAAAAGLLLFSKLPIALADSYSFCLSDPEMGGNTAVKITYAQEICQIPNIDLFQKYLSSNTIILCGQAIAGDSCPAAAENLLASADALVCNGPITINNTLYNTGDILPQLIKLWIDPNDPAQISSCVNTLFMDTIQQYSNQILTILAEKNNSISTWQYSAIGTAGAAAVLGGGWLAHSIFRCRRNRMQARREREALLAESVALPANYRAINP